MQVIQRRGTRHGGGDRPRAVADGSKLGEVKLAKVCDIDEVSLIISDDTADPAVVSEIETAGCPVELAP
jgi:DeoR/GlpR family transcriptional regulator of sugar metabolism